MPQGLVRFHETGQSHFVTFSCYHRLPKLADSAACQLFLEALERTRKRFAFRIYGYVLMPEHVHLLLREPASATLASALRSLKLSTAKEVHARVPRVPRRVLCGADLGTRQSSVAVNGDPFWQARYYDRNIRDYREFLVKLRYLHRNPVKRGLCQSPEQRPWSSYQHYLTGAPGIVEIESEWTASKREETSAP